MYAELLSKKITGVMTANMKWGSLPCGHFSNLEIEPNYQTTEYKIKIETKFYGSFGNCEIT
jgi:hypothetical protein